MLSDQVELDGDDLAEGVLQVGIAAAPVTSLASTSEGWLAAGTADGQVSPARLLHAPALIRVYT